MKKEWLLLVLILLLASLLRFYQLGKNPPGLNLDEVAIGYDAYSILKTGRDQYGTFLPISFRSYDDYKPSVLIYSVVPSVALLGLNDFAVRLPSAVYGVLTVLTVYFLVKELFPNNVSAALFSSFLFSISPWGLQFNRATYEVGAQPFFTSAGLLFFLRGNRKGSLFYFLMAAIFWGASIYLYTASRVFVPLFVILVGVLHFREWFKQKRGYLVFGLAFVILCLPMVFLLTTPAGLLRFQGTNIFQSPYPHEQNISWKITDWLRNDRFSAMLLHPQILEYSQEILYGYFAHFRPDFLFLGRDGQPANYNPRVGLIHLWELPFLIIGLYYLFRRANRKTALLLVGWIILGPLPASVTYGVPTSIRSALILPSLQIVTAWGLVNSASIVRREYRRLFLPFALVLFGASVYLLVYYLHIYYIHSPIENSEAWFYGYREIVMQTNKLRPKYNKVIVSTRLAQPQGFFLYYLKYDPRTYLTKYGGTVSGGYLEDRNHFENYYFKPIDFVKMSREPDVLFVGVPDEFPSKVPTIGKFYYLNGKTAAVIVGT